MTERKMIRVQIGCLMEHQLEVSFPDGLTSKIQKEIDKLEAIHEKEEAIMEAINDLLEDEDE